MTRVRRSLGRGLLLSGLVTTILVACGPDATTPDGATDGDGGPFDGATADTSPAVEDGAAGGDGSVSDGNDLDASVDADASGDAGTFQAACFVRCPVGTKLCDDRCVGIDDPRFGCDPKTCTPCAPLAPAHTKTATTCSAGVCKIGGATPTCRAGWGNCDNDWTHGCESDLSKPATCGACGNACAAGQVCDGNVCAAACTPPRDDCGDGSCHDFATSPTGCNCKVCSDQNGTATCTSATCGTTCDGGFKKCPGKDGCFDTSNDPSACRPPGQPDSQQCSTCLFSWPVVGPNNLADTAAKYIKGPACAAGFCAATCAEGFRSCSSGVYPTCVSAENDAKNCGACAKACAAGTTCLGTACVPLANVQIATSLITPVAMVGDASALYFTDSGGPGKVWRLDKATLAKTQIATLQSGVGDVKVRGAYVYWIASGTLRRAPTAGGAVMDLYATTGPFAVDDTNVYFGGGGTIYRASNAGGDVPVAFSTTAYRATDLLVDASRVYGWTYEGLAPPYTKNYYAYGIDKVTGTLRLYQNGTVSGTFADVPLGSAALDADAMLLGRVRTWPNSALHTVDVELAWHDPNRAAVDLHLWFGSIPVNSIAAGGTCGIYFGDGTTIWKIDPADQIPRRVSTAGTKAHHLVVDDAYVYWLDETWVGRVPK